MDRIVFDRMAAHDTHHWWYRARREILADYLTRYAGLPKDARILEIGCGTGHNLSTLARFGRIEAIEIDAAARGIATDRLGKPISTAPLPELPGVERGAYDLIAVLDVVEHIAEDVAALKTMGECLKPGGHILITVPAHPWLWTAHDTKSHHERRYTKGTLAKALDDAGLAHNGLRYFNSLLFPAAVAQRVVSKVTGKQDSDDAPPPRPINALFEKVFGLERHLVGRVPLPPGLSIITLASRK